MADEPYIDLITGKSLEPWAEQAMQKRAKADAIMALTNSGAPVPGDGDLRAALEEIELRATNQGGWFEQDPFGEYAKLGNIATNALAHAAPAPSDGADR